MRFHQVKELVDWAADYHARLADQYSRMAAAGDNERVRMALEYLTERERKMQNDLLGYLDDGSDHSTVLETWFDDPNDFPHAPVLERLPESANGESVQNVLATALTTHRTLQDLYAHRAELSGGNDERAFFEALASGHEAEVRRIARDMQRLEDY
ncbi:2-hydroxyacyl-CoA dehydratase [Billgrantia kenyensis]|uniref:2-hydroxyacyl-CoA dehydratase n=1 Tax=Billgrantia kenyensis TaxID=321266 RepID=A0A7W0AD67_9GAMM|nr:2-hydroxyacyl-CoA dehydratase [Halomonas kenyensis]MBA2778703.1 2-hydroxyacyl-CoA dehydratase [Halomonas kenyensis]MCG6661765.1 2-hydroxyacyl-CoA dehydratase [Halomonas kenyensis]